MGEIRQNKATKQWVIYAPSRDERPRDYQRGKEVQNLPGYDPDCPFCPGNEEMLPAIIMELNVPGKDCWQTRVVPNKFPALNPQGDLHRNVEGIYLKLSNFGRHEVIIENQRHDRGIAHMSSEEVDRIIKTYQRRYVQVMDEHDNMMAILFRNHGIRAGTSLLHPHSQLVVTSIVPREIRWRENEAQRYFDDWGSCVLCDIIAFETREGARIIQENDSFVSFVPYAAEVPFEIWIAPKYHKADFGAVSQRERLDLASSLRSVLTRLYKALNDPDYNYVIHSAAKYKADEPHLHWFLQIQPRMTTQAGFEIGSGMRINPSLPEEDALYLKEESYMDV
jgi:UDPglucose--hexose-1-phosphate uridylyltransferase